METHSIREEIIEIVNKLFVYTDEQKWVNLQNEVFTTNVEFNMSSVGGENKVLTSTEICNQWEAGFKGIDSINHLAGNFIVKIDINEATVFAYATATHFKNNTTNGKTREFVGTYDIGLLMKEYGWRIHKFRYNLKYATGNIDLL